MDKKQVINFIKQIAVAYPTFEPTPERLSLWKRKMEDVNYETAINTLDKYIDTHKFPPTIAEILNLDPKDNDKLINGHPF